MRGQPAPARHPGNDTAWGDYADVLFVVANGSILSVTSAVGIAANLFVILAVYRQKTLRTAMNALVVNLALVDALRCVVDCPVLFTIALSAHRRGHADELMCDVQVAVFSFSCCIQLLTLTCISAERHQAIARPFKTSERRRRIMAQIPLTWILATLVAFFCLIFMKDSPVYVKCKGLFGQPSSSYDTFGLYMLFPLWAACFAVIILFYASIFAIVRSHNRKIFDKGISLVSKTEDEPKNKETTAVENGPGKSGQNFTLSRNDASQITDLKTEQSQPPALKAALETAFKTEQFDSFGMKVEAKPLNGGAAAAAAAERSTTTLQVVSSNLDTESQPEESAKVVRAASEMKGVSPYAPSSAQLEKDQFTPVLLIKLKEAEKSRGGAAQAVATVDQASSLPPVLNDNSDTGGAKQSVQVEGAVCMMPSKASKERVHKRKESQMAKRAGYIILSFTLFWLPLIITILMNYVDHGNKNTVTIFQINLDFLSVSVACITSLSDPIIYAAVNPQFQTEFYRIKNKFVSIFKKT